MRHAPFILVALGLGLAAAVAAADGRWIEVRSPNFVVMSDAGEAEARRAAWQFEQVRALFEQQWPWARLSSGRPLLIFAARDEASLKALLPGYWEKKAGMRPAGLFVGGLERSYAALRVDVKHEIEEGEYYRNPYHVIYHEYVHLIVNLNFARMPVWLGEGLAEYWGDTVVEGGRVSKGLPIEGHLFLLRERALLPIETLLAVEPGSPHYTEDNKASIFYAQSWALVHYLFFGAEGAAQGSLDRLAAALKQGADPREAMARTLPEPAALGKALEAYLRRAAFRYQRGPAPLSPEAMKSYAARPLSPGQSRAARGAFLAHTGRLQEARPLIEEALRLEPDLAPAHQAQGLLAQREGKTQEARAAFGRAVELDPDDFLSHYMKGHYLLSTGNVGVEALAQAEAALLRSAQLNNDFAPAYALLSTVAMQRGATLEQTEPLARRAIALEPGNPAFQVSLALLLYAGGKAEAARQAGERAIAAARSDEERASIQEQLASYAEAGQALGGGPPTRGAASAREGGGGGIADHEKGCARGEAEACTDLALTYESGSGVAQDPARAVALHEKACGAGGAGSCDRLGAVYEFGWGVAVDLARAAAFYEKACGGERGLGCQRLGALRAEGRGVPKDAAGAIQAYDRACDVADEPDACALLAQLLVNGSPPKDPARAAALAARACAARNRLCGLLASFRRAGIGGAPDLARAASLFDKACAAGDSYSCTEAGLLRLAAGPAADAGEAGKHFEKACGAGDARACSHLGDLYEAGRGFPQDRARARRLYEQACAGGHAPACAKAK
jgi:TPR repeat protein